MTASFEDRHLRILEAYKTITDVPALFASSNIYRNWLAVCGPSIEKPYMLHQLDYYRAISARLLELLECP